MSAPANHWRLRGTSPHTGQTIDIASRKTEAEILKRRAFYDRLGYTDLELIKPTTTTEGDRR